MKNLTNILSYLWLLLLMVVTACSDLENEVDEMQQQLQEADLVELTIHPHVPGMKAGTRSTENDALTSIKVLAFDESRELIKVVDATNVTTGTTGSFSVRVPSKTRIIHFIGNLPSDVTLPSEGYSEDALKNLTTSGDMSYWGYASFNSVTELKAFKEQTLSLYRNKAKISITAAYGVTASIAGVANAYQYGVLVPNNNDGFNFNLDPYDYQTLPSNTTKKSEQTDETFTYVFEHPNDSKADALNVICKVGDLYYKVVLAKKVNDEMVYYDIIRNHQYNIKINQVDTNLGKDDFDDAADADNEPINDVEVVEDKQVTLQVTTSSSSTRSYDNTTYTVTVTTTESKLTDISTLSFSGLNADIYELTGTPTGVTDNGNSTYTVTADQAVFTFTLKDGYIGKEVSNSITFEGDGTHVVVTPATANLNLSTFVDMYEMYFEGDNLGGSTEYDKFFYDRNNVNRQTQTLTTQYVDAGANGSSLAHNHVNAAIYMQSNSTIKFTIAEERYLTLLVASNGDAPSINLTGTLNNGSSWTTAGTTDDLTNGTYNFAAEGEITTAGRLIRYTLPVGAYTLQRGNNDYLLYYMRVSTSKPTMTDIVQPAASDYSLSWSGNNGGYLKDPNNDAKYFVDEEATNFIPTLTYNGLSEVSLSTVKLDVTTDVWTFDNSDDSSQGSMQQDTRNYTEANISSLAYNEGAYTLSGSVTGISGTSYKYATFYDNLQLKQVEFNVKNTVKVALYNSWDGNAQPVTEFVEGGENNILGFKMPQHTLPVNPLNSEKINFTIDNSWQLNHPGAGIYQVEGSNYQIGDQANQNQQEGQTIHYHPRTEWTYKISWNNIPSNTITPTSPETDDVYFSYNGIVSKNPTIEFTTTQGAETPLNITVWTGERALEWSTDYLIVSKDIPIGSEVTLNFTTTGGSFKLHEQTGGANIIALPNVDYGSNSDNLGIISVNSGLKSYSFDVTNEITVNGKNISEKLDGLAINGTGVTMTSIVVTYPDGYVEEEEVIVNIDFRTYNQWTLWCEPDNRTPTVDSTNGFCLSNSEECSESYLPQYHLANGLTLESGTYEITMMIRGSVEGKIDRVGLGSWNTLREYSSSAMTFTTAWQEKTVEVEVTQATAQGEGFVMCQSGSFIGDLYIQTLKVVRSD